jgi:SNF2 family DNA or RNA helicase
MLTLGKVREGWLYWGEEDVGPMAKIIGPEAAFQRSAPWHPSLAKLAERGKVILHRKVKEELSIERTLRRVASALQKLKEAPGFNPKTLDPTKPNLWGGQRAGLHYMYTMKLPSYLIADEVGEGKTPLFIRWARMVRAWRILVLCTNSTKYQWRDEILKWDNKLISPREITIVEGTKAEQIRLAQTARGWIIGHHESLVHAREGYLAKPWDVVGVDEIHNFQNRQALRTDTLQALEAKYKAALTADPYSNNPDELFPILQFLYPTMYSSHERFFNMHVSGIPEGFGRQYIDGPKRPKLLKWEIRPFTLRRHNLNRPRLTRTPRHAILTPSARAEYEKLKKQFFVALDAHKGEKKILAIPSVLARVTRLRQYLIDPGLLGAKEPSPKFPLVEELLRETTRPVVIFTSFRQAGRHLGQYLGHRGVSVRYIDGGISPGDRRLNQKRFVAGKVDALVVVTKAGGEALNLGGHGIVIFLDLPWNYRALKQAEGRVNRPRETDGKIIPTTAYRIIVKDSYEQKMEAKLIDKFNMFKQVFTVSDLKELFA